MKNLSKLLLPALAASLLAAPAVAHEKGDIIVRVGVVTVDPNDDSGGVVVGGAETPLTVAVESDTQISLTGTYMLTDNIGLGLLAATPFSHDINLENDVLGIGNGALGSTDHLPPTLTVQYFPNNSASAWQPYVGIGLNYTVFFDEKFEGSREAQGFADLDLDDSFGIAFEAGVDYKLNDKWLLNASAWYLDIDTDAEFTVGGAPASVAVDIDPLVYTFSVGYQF